MTTARHSTRLFICMLASITATISVAAPFSNGSFELPGGGPIRSIIDIPGNIPGWLHGGIGTEVYESSQSDQIDAQNGGYYVSFGHNGNTGGTLSQTFDTVVGQSYTVSYYVTSQQGVGTGQSLSLTAYDAINGNKSLAQSKTNISEKEIRWEAGNPLTFIAASASTTLTFLDTTDTQGSGSGVANWGLDNVSVTQNAPQTMAIGAVATGTPDKLNLTANVRVGSADINKPIQLYVVGIIDGIIVFKQNGGFSLPSRNIPTIFPVAQSGIGSNGDINIPILINEDMRGAKGMLFIVGYGSNQADMLANSKFQIVYTVN